MTQFDDFKIETQRLVISSFSGEVQYELDWELFGRVEPERCLIKPNPTKTIIQLRKCEQGYWGHLTKDKKKPRYLSKAYDSIVCSDEEDQVDDDSLVLSRPKQSLFSTVDRSYVKRDRPQDTNSEDAC